MVKELRSRYYFERLPFNFFKSKELLPTFPSTINRYISKLGIQIPTTNPHDTQFLIKNLRTEYRFSLPLGVHWVNEEISQTDKPKLPRKLSDIDPNLNIKHLSRDDTLFREKIKILHNHYEFQRIPENWFTNPRIPLPEDPLEINRILKEKNKMPLKFPLVDNDALPTLIFQLHQTFSFSRLHESLIVKETLPEPEFDLMPFLC